jgi:hypothetical protein
MDKEQGEICRMQINPADFLLFSIKEYKGKHYNIAGTQVLLIPIPSRTYGNFWLLTSY